MIATPFRMVPEPLRKAPERLYMDQESLAEVIEPWSTLTPSANKVPGSHQHLTKRTIPILRTARHIVARRANHLVTSSVSGPQVTNREERTP